MTYMNKGRKTRYLPALAAVALAMLGQSPHTMATATEEEEEACLQAAPQDLEWFREARVGLFVCWGPVSLVGTEIGWSRGGVRRGLPADDPVWGDMTNQTLEGCPVDEYDNLYKRFNPTEFDAEEWVETIRAAGMKYVIFLTKHHDGFCMFDSALTDYDIMSTPFARDVTRELAHACQEAGIRVCWYYSQPDWHHPDYYTENHEQYIEYLHGQVRELLTKYGKIDVMWFDGLFCTEEKLESRRLMKMIRELQPGILINNRIGGLAGDFVTPEQVIGRYQEDPPWESCITMGTQWSWKPADEIKTLKESIQTLVRCAGGDGNLAYNVGPMPDGRIEPRQVDVLRGMGAWLRAHGKAVYGTRGGPYLPGNWGASTRSANTVYLHVMEWKQDELRLPPLPTKVVAAKTLTGGEARVSQDAQGLTVRVAPEHRDDVATVVALTLDGPASSLEPITLPSGSLATGRPVRASSFWGLGYEPEMAFDDDEATRWGVAPGSTSGWLEVDLGTETTISRAVINQEGWNRIVAFQLQRHDGESWKAFYSSTEGERIGGKVEVSFAPVKASQVRLAVTETTAEVTIWEFQLFKD